MQPYLPLGMLYAASALRRSGISVAAFDSMLEDPSAKLPALLAKHRPRIVAVYEDDFNFLSKMCLTRMREVAWEIAQAARAIETAVDRAFAAGLKPCEFGGRDGTAAIATAVLRALDNSVPA